MNAQTTTKQNGFRGASESKDHQVSSLHQIRLQITRAIQGIDINNQAAVIELLHADAAIEKSINYFKAN